MKKFGTSFFILTGTLFFICHESGYTQDKQAFKKSVNKKYSTYSIENFKCFISEEVMEQNSGSAWTNKPVDLLAKALRRVNEVYPENAKVLFHKTFIFVDWDKPGALGLYSQGPRGPSDPKTHFNCIDINGMKLVTEKNNDKKLQPNNAATLVLLHELAHCYHHQVLGWNHELIKDAYQNAKNQKLFDLKSYLMSSDKEYFAELTTAYLDKHLSIPRSREEIKEKDIQGYGLMQKIWGKGKSGSINTSSKHTYSKS
ncbi:MAG: hypothetical protein EBQ87_12565 [Planctomycetes bacterium]|nr:hypothetical protein [Planctomycetota bacterium]